MILFAIGKAPVRLLDSMPSDPNSTCYDLPVYDLQHMPYPLYPLISTGAQNIFYA